MDRLAALRKLMEADPTNHFVRYGLAQEFVKDGQDRRAVREVRRILSENADFAERVEHSGFTFIGPHPDTIRLMGDKLSAIAAMREAGIPCVPGSGGPIGDDPQETLRIARDIGYPVIVKAAGGGGGRGMRVVHSEASLLNAVSLTRAEAGTA